MGVTVTQLYRKIDETRAYCFNVESSRGLSPKEMTRLRLILADGLLIETVQEAPVLSGASVAPPQALM